MVNKLLDIEKVCFDPEKYGFEKVDGEYKGNSVVIDPNVSKIDFTNFHYIINNNNTNYLEEGIALIIPTKHILTRTIELKR